MAYTFKHGDRPIDGYTIQRAVGRGGFGEVYYAISDGGREVAIKYLRDNPQIELRGVSLVINLKSPHLVSIFDVKKTQDDEYGIIMEYCSGPSLRDLLIAEPNGFAPEKAAFFLREIGKGLAYLHDHGIVHRDLKPGNIFFDDAYVKIGDYGLSKIISVSRHSAQTASVGTVHYMAPEIGSGNYSRGVDIYALGVMLYEMLMGAVPFEGSTMAEVLMKHLTSQPELDQLPQPFAKVVRKALEKDPKDRYQTVDEMVEELLGAEEIQKSVAGFSPKSLQHAVAQVGGARHASPRPSPNPIPRGTPPKLPPYAVPVGSGPPLTGKARKRMDRIARKVERKRAKLDGRRPSYDAARRPRNLIPPSPEGQEFLSKRLRRRRMLLTVFMGALLSVALGIVCGTSTNVDEIGGTAGMLIPALTLGIALSRKAYRWFGVEDGPGWAAKLIRAGYAAPLLAVACAPVMDRYGDGGMVVWVAMSIVAMLFNWDKTLDMSAGGELSFGRAIWTGFAAMITYAIVSGITSGGAMGELMGAIAGAAGITSLLLQASSWWLVPVSEPHGDGPEGGGYGDGYDDRHGPNEGGPAPYDTPPSAAEAETIALGARPPVVPSADNDAPHEFQNMQDQLADPRTRWGVTRAFWGVIAFLAMIGSIVTFIFAIVGSTGELTSNYHDHTALIIACVGLASVSIFALRKTTAIKRDGFWRETLRPLMQSACLFTIGATITVVAREWDHIDAASQMRCLADDERAAAISGLVIASIMFIALTLFTGRGKRRSQGFLTGPVPLAATADHAPNDDGGRVVNVGHPYPINPLTSDEGGA